jgi:8-oxo-dGTP pyrophosphatase MutT (NUDIX family)
MKWILTLAYHANRLRCFLLRPLSISVKLILVQDGKIVLVQHSYQRGWHIPGGGVKRGETLEQAARREAREELGATLNNLRLHGIYTLWEYKSDHADVWRSVYAIIGDAEIEHFEFFRYEACPRVTRPVVARWKNTDQPASAVW